MLNPDQKSLVNFVQKFAALLPLDERAAVYRGLADFSDVIELVHAFTAKARVLEAAEAKCRGLDLNLTEFSIEP